MSNAPPKDAGRSLTVDMREVALGAPAVAAARGHTGLGCRVSQVAQQPLDFKMER